MPRKYFHIYLFCMIFCLALFFACDGGKVIRSEDPEETSLGILAGTVMNANQPSKPVSPAFVIEAKNWLSVTDDSGAFQADSLNTGNLWITFSAINYRDTTMEVLIEEGKTTRLTVLLTPDTEKSRLYGEVQDMTLFEEAIQNEPEIANWDDKEMFDGVTGATLQKKWLHYDIPTIFIYLEDSLVTGCDAFAQFWCELQCGTYPLTSVCEGYRSVTEIVTVKPDQKNYSNFFMDRE